MYIMHMVKKRYNQYMETYQIDKFESLRNQTGISVSELMRRMFDLCLTDNVVNQIIPCMSGQISVGR